MQAIKKRFQLALVLILVIGLPGCEQIVNQMAFHPDSKNVLSTSELPPNVQEVFIKTKDNLRIQGYFILSPNSAQIVIYFHGNAGNIGHRLPDLLRLSSFGINVLGVGYRGYGKSQGKPSEQGIYADGEAALNYATRELGFAPEGVFVMGRSIGTCVAVNVSRQKNIGGLILVSPLTSGADQAKASGLGLVAFVAGDSFNNIGKMGSIQCPVLIVHGTRDNIIPLAMGKELFLKTRTQKKLVEIKDANHNNLSTQFAHKYWPPIKEFIKR